MSKITIDDKEYKLDELSDKLDHMLNIAMIYKLKLSMHRKI